jgi:hypothetical protein
VKNGRMIKSSIKFRYRPAWKARKYASGNEMRKASTVAVAA